MGMPAALIGGALLGLGATALMGRQNKSSFDYGSTNSSVYDSAASTMPVVPDAPVAEDGAKSDAVLAAEEEQRKKAAAATAANRTNLTGGLGVTTPASVQRKTLLG